MEISGPKLMESAKPYVIYPGFAFVCYPNRDSTEYKERYHIPEAETIVRGTLRYQGFPEFVRTLVDMGFLSEEKNPILAASTGKAASWREVTAKILNASSSKEEDLVWAISSKTKFADTDEKYRIISGLKWLGMFSDDAVEPKETPLDTLCATLEKKMAYDDNERDMCILQHRFDVELKDGTRQTRTSTLLDFGVPGGYSSMAKLVGVPCGVACQQVLDGVINTPGVLAPMSSKLNNPLIEALKKEGIECKEEIL